MSKPLQKGSKVFVAGHRGLVGSAITRALRRSGYTNLIERTRKELDLQDPVAVRQFFAGERPEYVFLAAAKVGGIAANNSLPAEFIEENLAIELNVVRAARESGVERLLFLGSSCIYPKLCPQPMKEEYLMTGPLEPTNRPYAVAKIAGIEMCWASNRQHGTEYLAAMPTNLYGPGDNYDLKHSHVIPALLHKMHDAKESRAAKVNLWGTGTPKREFLYSDDLAAGCLFLMELDATRYSNLLGDGQHAPLINIGYGEDVTIAELSRMVAEVVGFDGELSFDPNMPDGTPRKLLDVTRMKQLGWTPRVDLRAGLRLAYQDFLDRALTLK